MIVEIASQKAKALLMSRTPRLASLLSRYYRRWRSLGTATGIAFQPKPLPDNMRVTFPVTNVFLKSLDMMSSRPTVSLVIVSYARPDLVENLIKSIWLFSAKFRYEIIVVENGSPPGSNSVPESIAKNIRAIYLQRPLYLGDAYNIGVEEAGGKYVVLMNNDIVVQTGWLSALIEPMERDSTIGATGPRFLYPSGLIQEAGAFITPDGSSWQRGKGESNDERKFAEPQPVDYVSAATLAMPRRFYLECGGLDWRWEPGYFEDVDLCFKLRSRGLKILYVPSASVFHIESATTVSRPDIAVGFVDNQRKFVTKWREWLVPEKAGATSSSSGIALDDAIADRIASTRSGLRSHRGSVAMYDPFDFRPGGGEQYALSVLAAFEGRADLYLIRPSKESVLRIFSAMEELGFSTLDCKITDEDEAEQIAPFDYFFLMGNQIYPHRKGLGKTNFYVCQFPFSQPEEAIARTNNNVRDYSRYIVYSRYVQDHVRRILAMRGTSGVEVQVLAPNAGEILSVDPNWARSPNIIGVGRFFVGAHNKRHDVMIDALQRLVQQAPDDGIRLDIVGASHTQKEHQDHLRRLLDLAKESPISFHVDATRQELNDLYRGARVYWHAAGFGADLAAFPERAEHFGITVVEAMAAGAVPVVFDAGGPAEVVTHGRNGFKYRTVDELVALTLDVLRNWDSPRIQELSRNAQAAATKYSRSAFYSQVRALTGAKEALFEEAATNQGPIHHGEPRASLAAAVTER